MYTKRREGEVEAKENRDKEGVRGPLLPYPFISLLLSEQRGVEAKKGQTHEEGGRCNGEGGKERGCKGTITYYSLPVSHPLPPPSLSHLTTYLGIARTTSSYVFDGRTIPITLHYY